MSEKLKISLFFMLVLIISGCNRLQAPRTNDYDLYPGVRLGFKVVRIEKSIFNTIAAISQTFDFVLDTVLLPRDAV